MEIHVLLPEVPCADLALGAPHSHIPAHRGCPGRGEVQATALGWLFPQAWILTLGQELNGRLVAKSRTKPAAGIPFRGAACTTEFSGS